VATRTSLHSPPIALRASALRRTWSVGVFGAALASSFVIYASLWRDPFHRAPGDPTHHNDPIQGLWMLKWVPWALFHGHFPLHTDAIYYPHGASLSWNPSMPTLGILAAPLTFTAGVVFTWVLLLTIAPALASLTAFWWLRRHTEHPLPAAAGALFIGFGPYMTGHMQGQVNLTFTALIPLMLMVTEDLLWRHPRSDRRSALSLGVLTAAQAGIDEELVLITVIAVVVALAFALLVRPAQVWSVIVSAVRPLLLAVGVFVALASPLLVHQLFLSKDVGLHAGYWKATVGDYFLPLKAQVVRPYWHHLSYLGGSEDGVYLGPLLAAVLAVGVALTFRRDRRVRVAAGTLAVLVLLTFGDSRPLGIPLPWSYVEHLPALTSILPGRFSFASDLVIAWLLTVWVDGLLAVARTRRPEMRSAGAPARAMAVVALAAVATALFTVVPRWIGASNLPSAAPFDSRELRTLLPQGSPVLLLPAPTYNDDTGMYVQLAADFRFRQPGGYALRPDGRNTSYGPPTTPLITLSGLARTNSPVSGGLLNRGRAELAAEHYAAIVVLPHDANLTVMTGLGEQLTGRPPDRVVEGAPIWILNR
jgi:hypothetical protein